MKVYIAGKITDNPNYVEEFSQAEEYLKSKGHAVINPVKNVGFTYKEYIDMGLNELSKCDAIVALPNYEDSQGAMLEVMYASAVGIKFISYQKYVEMNIR